MMSEHAETVLSEHILAHSELTEEVVNEKGVSLGNALMQFDEYVRSLQIDPCSPNFCLVTDGQFPLRQCLHPESCSKNIDLAPYYNTFHDLRKDFRAFYSAPDVVNSIKEMITYLSMTFDTENEFYVKEAKDMVNIVHRLIADGKCSAITK
ncbi:RNA-binding protein fusilli-like [Frankliniella occidentalis]|uniref:RNA-binding protein fusilli-like n=1 Tax=Frankliniella occidentalis TaxID=133901 RepID=A0A9C6X858_FRAOC|nr:RNA-binding protein fusilli-like [Frankliniella occidentalis]